MGVLGVLLLGMNRKWADNNPWLKPHRNPNPDYSSHVHQVSCMLKPCWHPEAADGVGEKWRMVRWAVRSTSVSYIRDSRTNFSFRLGTLLLQKYLTQPLSCFYCENIPRTIRWCFSFNIIVYASIVDHSLVLIWDFYLTNRAAINNL